MPEITDAQLAELQGTHRLANALMQNPETKDGLMALLKKINPKASLPEYDTKQAVTAQVKELEDKFEKLQTSLLAKDEDSKMVKRFDDAMTKHGITDDGREKVKTLMAERNIFDPEAAALTFLHDNPPPAPTTGPGWTGSRMFDTGENSDLSKWLKDPEGMRDAELNSIYGRRAA